jgi:outer membrane protein TolC
MYSIDQIKYQIASLKKLLNLKVGKKIDSLENSEIKVPQEIQHEISDDILALQATASSLNFTAEMINSAYYPKLRVEDTYSLYSYERKSPIVNNLDNQNSLMVTLNLKLFDMGTLSKQKESFLIQKDALQKEIEQAQDEQEINIELAQLKIETTKAQILSAKSSLDSATSAYATISMKYEAGAVDNVTYLDSLSIKTNATAQYKFALNNLQIAYASYYYYTNKEIKEFIK